MEPKVVYLVVEHLQIINFNKTDLDTKGIAFEKFMEEFFRGKMGQFFTPRKIIEFCVKMLEIEPDNRVLDPACGSGGFLLHSMDFVRENAEDDLKDELEALKIWHPFAMNKLYGIEINDQIARVCKMNMILHDDGHSNIISTDALENISDLKEINPDFKENNFDLILTNPPFGASIKESEKWYLKNFELGGKLKNRKSQKTEILFIERCLEFLRPDGKMAIVLPDGILTNSSLQYVRDYIMENAEILAVVSLPQFAFTHYGAGVKSSLLFLRKKIENDNLGNYPIFMAISEHIGYDATGREDKRNDLDPIYDEYQTFLKDQISYNGLNREED